MRSRIPSDAPGTMARLPPTRSPWCRRRTSSRPWKKRSRSASAARIECASSVALVLECRIARRRIAHQLQPDVGTGILSDVLAVIIDRWRTTVCPRRRLAREEETPRKLLRTVDALRPRLFCTRERGRCGDHRKHRNQDNRQTNPHRAPRVPPDYRKAGGFANRLVKNRRIHVLPHGSDLGRPNPPILVLASEPLCRHFRLVA